MGDLRSSNHFVELDALPQFDATTSFRDLYSEIHSRGSSGFVVVSEAGRRYVKGSLLAEQAVKADRSESIPDTLRDISLQPIGKVISRPWAAGCVLRIADTAVDVASDVAPLQNQADAVFSVASGGTAVGWFLNHETVLDTATGKTVWVCENGHDNPDSDHGTCYSCPGDIVGTRKVQELGSLA